MTKIIDSILEFLTTTKVDIKIQPNDVNMSVEHKDSQLKVEYKEKNKEEKND